MTDIYRALSIRQPWAWAIFHAGKTVENRDWTQCRYRGPVLVHAAKGCTKAEYASACDSIQNARRDIGVSAAGIPALQDQTRGAIVGIARIADALRHPRAGTVEAEGADGRVRGLSWERGYVGYRLAGALGLQLVDVHELSPVPLKGALGFFHVDSAALPAEYRDTWRRLAAKAVST